MKLICASVGSWLLLLAGSVYGQTNPRERLVIPGLDPASQSNVVVTVCGFDGRPCPLEYTNSLSNSNLFTREEQELIKQVFVKYKNVTTNSGPPGTVLTRLYKTNFVIKVLDRTAEIENWVARFQYTNSEAYEEVAIGRSLSAKYRTRSDDGYNVSFSRVGGGTGLWFVQIKQNQINGVLAEFLDMHEQGSNWNYSFANFEGSPLTEYRQYSNGMVLGKFFMWKPQDGKLIIQAEFKEPYDWMKHYRYFR